MSEAFETRHAIMFEQMTGVPWPEALQFPNEITALTDGDDRVFGMYWYTERGFWLMSARFDRSSFTLYSHKGVVKQGRPGLIGMAAELLSQIKDELSLNR